MNPIVLLSGSNSSTSINTALLRYTQSQIPAHTACEYLPPMLDMPLYSQDIENNQGFPEEVDRLHSTIRQAQGLIIAVNEHNGALSAFFKNVIDWLSRKDRAWLAQKKIFLLSTSPGKRGGQSALEYAEMIMKRFEGEVLETFSLPSFHQNFQDARITDPGLKEQHAQQLDSFLQQLSADS